MLEKWLKLFLGEKILSSLMGILGGVLSGVATVAVTGNLEKSALVTGAVGGAAAAVIGAGGRITGERKGPAKGMPGSGIMLTFLIIALCCMPAAGCIAGTTANVGDGQVDVVETATIRLAVGAAMSARPETVIPAYAVTKTLLAVMDGSEAVQVRDLDKALADRVDSLDLTAVEKQSVFDLAALVRANIQSHVAGLTGANRFVIIRAVLEIVHDSAAFRLQLVKAPGA